MEIKEALEVVSLMIDGKNPATGERIEDSHVWNNSRVLRSLFMAAEALKDAESRQARKRVLPNKSGQAWSENEDQELLRGFDGGVSLVELARRHDRTEGAVTARLIRHGRLQKEAWRMPMKVQAAAEA